MPIIDHSLNFSSDDGVDGWIVMPRAAFSLEERIDVLSGRVEFATELLCGIVNGIKAAHEKNVVHRDIKPANILFMDDSMKMPLVSDFGICLLRETPEGKRLTEVNETVGPRFFMAPEQERGGIADVKESADLYALGKLYHFMLTGRRIHREDLSVAFSNDELSEDARFEYILNEVLAKTILESPEHRFQSCDDLLKVLVGFKTRKSGSSVAKRPTNVQSADQSPPSQSALDSFYRQYLDEIGKKNFKKLEIEVDVLRSNFTNTWENLRQSVESNPNDAADASKRLIESQAQLVGYTLAVARYDCVELFTPIKRTIEYILAASDKLDGYTAVIGIPHPMAGFLYMAMSTVALAFENWGILEKCLNSKFEWGRSTGRQVYECGFDVGLFFHSESFGRSAPKIHDMYRELLLKKPVLEALGKRNEDIFDSYVQTQFLMCLRAAQEIHLGNQKVRIWSDYGRFHEERVERLIDKVHHDDEFSRGLIGAFHETRESFFEALNRRIQVAFEFFGNGSGYSYNSVTSWEPRS